MAKGMGEERIFSIRAVWQGKARDSTGLRYQTSALNGVRSRKRRSPAFPL